MKTTKSIFAILLTVIMIATIFIGCKKEEESKPVNATEPITVETVDEIIDNLTEGVSIEDTTKDENGNEIVVGKDKDGNTVEVKTDKDGNVVKTITDKDTGKKTEQTTTKKAVTTTKKPVTTTKKSVTTTKPTTTKKPVTTTKPTTTKKVVTTTVHTHGYTPVYKTQRVKIKDAYDEPVYKTVQAFYCRGCGIEEVTESKKYGVTYQTFHTKHTMPKRNDGIIPLCPKASNTNAPVMVSGDYFGKPNTVKIQTSTIHHDAVYEDRKIVDYYKCYCGATKK